MKDLALALGSAVCLGVAVYCAVLGMFKLVIIFKLLLA